MKSIIILTLLLQLFYSELIFVQQLFRHGARYPLHPSQKDGTQYAAADNMAGQLTSEGKRMHYLLGKKLKQDYWTKLGLTDIYNSSYVFIKSTNVNRTLESGQSQFLGWVESLKPLQLTQNQALIAIPPWSAKQFDKPAGNVFINSPQFKPNAIHSEKSGSNALNNGDFLLAYSSSNCPSVASWSQQGYNSDLYKNVSQIDKIQKAVKAMQAALNDSTIDLVGVSQYYQNYQCSKRLGKPYNNVFNGQFLPQFGFIQTFVKYTDLASSDIQINSTVTGFFNATLNAMNKIIQNKQKQKLVLYSAHDLTIVMALAGLRIGSRQCALNHYNNPNETSGCIYQFPDFASSLIFELHEQNSTNFVRFRYNGDYLKLPFCASIDCAYSQFSNHLSATLRSTFISDCGVPPIPSVKKQTQLIIANIVIGVFLLLAVGYQVFLFTKKKKSNPIVKYDDHVQEI